MLRDMLVQRGRIRTMLAATSAADTPHSDSSITWPKFEVVRTEYHEHTSAITINGTTILATVLEKMLPVARAVSRVMSAHWQAKQSSAMVATDRPTSALDTQESKSPRRGTSN